jgi:hypothetical protein
MKARLCSEFDLPDQFTLIVATDSAPIQRACYVIWRLGTEFGVKF